MAVSEQFDSVIAKMPVLLERLKSSPALARDSLRGVPDHGIYVFYENETPVYAGRSNSLRQRILTHGRQSSWHMSATFAFLLAEEEARSQDLDLKSMTRMQQQNDPEFRQLYTQAKARVGRMLIRVVEVNNPIEQTIFEVYAALTLGTRYNDFDTH